jgi:hypothetical protein
MEGFTDKQNKVFGKLFGEIKRQKNPNFRSDAIAMLKLDDENFTKLYTDPMNEITGDDEDIDLCHDRAKHLGIGA